MVGFEGKPRGKPPDFSAVSMFGLWVGDVTVTTWVHRTQEAVPATAGMQFASCVETKTPSNGRTHLIIPLKPIQRKSF